MSLKQILGLTFAGAIALSVSGCVEHHETSYYPRYVKKESRHEHRGHRSHQDQRRHTPRPLPRQHEVIREHQSGTHPGYNPKHEVIRDHHSGTHPGHNPQQGGNDYSSAVEKKNPQEGGNSFGSNTTQPEKAPDTQGSNSYNGTVVNNNSAEVKTPSKEEPAKDQNSGGNSFGAVAENKNAEIKKPSKEEPAKDPNSGGNSFGAEVQMIQ